MPLKRSNDLGSIGLLILRLGVGGYMLSHGIGKMRMTLAGEFGNFGDPIGLGSGTSLVLVTIAEFVCAILVMLGLWTRFAAVPVVIAMAVAAFVVHASDPWTMQSAAMAFYSGESESWASKEPALLYLIPFLMLIFTGAGTLSLDGWIRARRGSV